MEVAEEDSEVETVEVQEEDSVEVTVVDEVDLVVVEVRIHHTLLEDNRRMLTLVRSLRSAGGRGGRGGGRGGYGGFAPQGPPDSVLGKQLIMTTWGFCGFLSLSSMRRNGFFPALGRGRDALLFPDAHPGTLLQRSHLFGEQDSNRYVSMPSIGFA